MFGSSKAPSNMPLSPARSALIHPHHLPPDILKEERSLTRLKAVAPTKQEIKKRQLIDALARAKGNQSLAAEILGISRVTVWNRMKRFGITYTRHLEHELGLENRRPYSHPLARKTSPPRAAWSR